MASPAAGTIELGWWTASAEEVSGYIQATADNLEVYQRAGAVPPLAIAARALAGLLEALGLPPGAIHGAQEIQCHRATSFGERLHLTAEVGRPTQRGGFRFIAASFAACDHRGERTLTGKSTVILPPEVNSDG